MSEIKKFIGFSVLDFIFWSFFAAFIGYITTYMLNCGLSSAMLSIVLAAYMLMAFAGAFYWGGKSDKKGTNKKVFIPVFIAASLIALGIYFVAGINIMIAAVIYPFLGFMIAPLGSNLDAWMLRSFQGDASVYGRARAIGAAGYAVMMLASGNLINMFGYIVIPVSTAIISLLVLILAFILPEEKFANSGVKVVKPGSPKDLLKIAPYMVMIVILFMTGMAVSPINNLKIVILESVGGDVSSLGMDAFIGVMVQALFIFISGKLRVIPAYFRLLMMSLLAMGMLLLTYFAVSPVMIMIGSVLNNVSYGVMLPTTREIANDTVSPQLRNTAYSMSDATFGSFAGVIALTYSGALIDAFGARSVALLGIGIMCVPVLLSLIVMLRNRKKTAA